MSVRFSPRSPSPLLFLHLVGPPSQPPTSSRLSFARTRARSPFNHLRQPSVEFLCLFFCSSASSSTSTDKIFTSARGADVGLNAVLRSERERPSIQSYRLFDEHRPNFSCRLAGCHSTVYHPFLSAWGTLDSSSWSLKSHQDRLPCFYQFFFFLFKTFSATYRPAGSITVWLMHIWLICRSPRPYCKMIRAIFDLLDEIFRPNIVFRPDSFDDHGNGLSIPTLTNSTLTNNMSTG